MKKSEKIAIAIVAFATIGTLISVFSIEKFRRDKLYTAELIARAPENGNWYPQQLHVPYGKEITLYIRNIETVSHGFALPAFNVAVSELKAGTVNVVKFTADKKGTFPFMCTVWCSEHHLDMRGELIVE
ncbi:MAG: cupredoxin domain-containing protein [bacterium]|nr:cupredoxin domain-containing protein [bacterium]